MLDSLVAIIAPHRCLACRAPGSLVCNACIGELSEAREPLCLLCAGVCDERGLCSVCSVQLLVERALLFGERGGVLQALVNQFKFDRKRAGFRPIAQLLGGLLPYRLPDNAVMVPLPTVARHIRERGYDHTALVARRIAYQKKVPYSPVLRRVGSSVQRGASKHERITQGDHTFTVLKPLDPSRLYIVVDDIVTTGASLRAAAQTLRTAGATRIWVLALARQPLDEQR